eukprot:GHVN01063713.1.p1 GENE.GHVN01063713.1~~GHVN01063713.1.p1  ORF type:complete len:132 (+),score=26.91 GHVN01063713.1:86-481(+)
MTTLEVTVKENKGCWCGDCWCTPCVIIQCCCAKKYIFDANYDDDYEKVMEVIFESDPKMKDVEGMKLAFDGLFIAPGTTLHNVGVEPEYTKVQLDLLVPCCPKEEKAGDADDDDQREDDDEAKPPRQESID